MNAVAAARRAATGVEIGQLKAALDTYKKEHGDFPPSFDWDPAFPATAAAQQGKWWDNSIPGPSAYAYQSICERHLLRCYPKAIDKAKFYRFIAPILDQDEALVFWLYMIANDPKEPFKNFAYNSANPNIYYAGGFNTNQLVMNDFPGTYTRYSHFDFDARRFIDSDGDGIPGYMALYSRETTYFYFDSRTYAFPTINDPANNVFYAARGVAQPFVDATTLSKPNPKFVNPDTFQILSSGQDGNFGMVPPNATFNWLNLKQFPTMINTNEEDSDNLADFTEGRRLIDHRP
jgi:hypothetical protein